MLRTVLARSWQRVGYAVAGPCDGWVGQSSAPGAGRSQGVTMATIPVTLIGVAYTDKTGNPPTPVTIVAELHYTGLAPGGGPMPGGPPLGFWGGTAPPFVDAGPPGAQPPSGAHPAHPIWRPDLGFWGGRPPNYVDIGLPMPQPPTGPADENGFIKPPPPGGGWSYHEDYGWMFSPGSQTPVPKTTPAT
jgi:hypothetical protein